MKDKDFDARFPWTLAFVTCSICYFGFIRLMRLLNIYLPAMFLWMGVGSLLLGCISGIVSVLLKKKPIHRPAKLMKSEMTDTTAA